MREAIISAFKSKGKESMKKPELVMTLAFDLGLFSPEEAKRVVDLAIERGWLVGDEELHPKFEEKGVFDRIVQEIAEKTGKSFEEVVAMINKRQEELGNLLSVEVVALLVAKEFGIDVRGYIDEVEKRVLNQ